MWSDMKPTDPDFSCQVPPLRVYHRTKEHTHAHVHTHTYRRSSSAVTTPNAADLWPSVVTRDSNEKPGGVSLLKSSLPAAINPSSFWSIAFISKIKKVSCLPWFVLPLHTHTHSCTHTHISICIFRRHANKSSLLSLSRSKQRPLLSCSGLTVSCSVEHLRHHNHHFFCCCCCCCRVKSGGVRWNFVNQVVSSPSVRIICQNMSPVKKCFPAENSSTALLASVGC